MANNRVSILARQAQLGQDVDTVAAQAALDQAIQDAGPAGLGPEEPANIRYYRALLRAASGQVS